MRSAFNSRYTRALLCALIVFASVPSVYPQASDGQKYYILQKGDTLYSVARKYNISYEALLAANSIADPTKLRAGQKILIPCVYTVVKGDTLYGIARASGSTVTELCSLNGIKESSPLRPGMSLILPSGKDGGQVSSATVEKKPAHASSSSGSASASASHTQTGQEGQVFGSSNPSIAIPEPMKVSDRKVDKTLSWPCQGEAHYLDGKLFGIMIRTQNGEKVRSVIAGKVVSAGPYRGYGQVVFIQSKTGYIYVYGGNENLSVKVGDAVKVGDELGRVALDIKEGQPVEYFFVFHRGTAVDPAKAPRG